MGHKPQGVQKQSSLTKIEEPEGVKRDNDSGGGGGGGGGGGADDDDDFVDQGIFKSSQRPLRTHVDIYSKRNQYASLNRVKDYFDEEGYDLTKKAPEVEDETGHFYESSASSRRTSNFSAFSGLTFNSEDGSRSLSSLSDGPPMKESSETPEKKELTSRELLLQKLGISPKEAKGKRKEPRRRHRGRPSRGKDGGCRQTDFMKDLLVKNAHQRYHHNARVPFESRLKDFYHNVAELIEKEEELTNAELEKKWNTITQNVKAVLADSSDEDEEENALHTI